MCGVWDALVQRLTGTDVAICLKVSKKLRAVLGQCLASSTKLRQRMTVAVTKEALTAGRALARHQVEFKRDDLVNWTYSGSQVYALDEVLYQQQDKTAFTNILKMDPKGGKPVYKKSVVTGYSDKTYSGVSIHPTTNSNKVFLDSKINPFLLDFEPSRVKATPKKDFNMIGNGDPKKKVKEVEKWVEGSFPYYLRYLLFAENHIWGEGKATLTMVTIDGDGNFDKSIELYQFHRYCPEVLHKESKEEVGTSTSNRMLDILNRSFKYLVKDICK